MSMSIVSLTRPSRCVGSTYLFGTLFGACSGHLSVRHDARSSVTKSRRWFDGDTGNLLGQ